MKDVAIRAALDRIWQRTREGALERVAVLEAAAAAAGEDRLTTRARREAERTAYKLAGEVSAFGFWQAATLAREAEGLLAGSSRLSRVGWCRLHTIAEAIRLELDHESPVPQAAKSSQPTTHARVVLVGQDADFRERLAVDARALGIEIIGAETAEAARARINRSVDAVLIDLTVDGIGVPFLEELHHEHPKLRTIVISHGDAFQDRVDAARLGSRGFLQKPVRPQQVIDLLRTNLLVASAERPTIVAVDDDVATLSDVRELLCPLDARVVTVLDPTAMLPVLGETAPDLVILDVDMPGFDGIELCRILRNDPRWSAVPVVFLTNNIDPFTVTRMFDAGGDDFIQKPLGGCALVACVRNRLERTQMLRLAADVDSLTGVATRRRGVEVLDRFFRLAQRQRQPVSVGVIDLDHFKEVNDRFGHSVGDTVLRRTATILAGCFRGEDVVARWGGEEFVVGMYSMPCAAAARRLEQALQRLREERFDVGHNPVRMTFSAGVAEFPRDGADWNAVYHAADEALGRAKAEGRDRVLPARL